jgi:hypothetical protein
MPPAAKHVSPYSGSWYPGDASELNTLLNELWERSELRRGPYLLPDAVAFIVPHAGLAYSGAAAAAAYRHLQKLQPERVVLIGFSHHGAPKGVWVPDVESFATPLGEVRVDQATVRDLVSSPDFRRTSETALCDHSVEIQLPLLQKAAPKAQVVPLYVSGSGDGAAEKLAGLIGPGTVLVASSDFTHFGESFHFRPFPVDEDTEERLRELDYSMIEAAGSIRRDVFLKALRATAATLCGYEPISLLLDALRVVDDRDEIFQEKLDYQTSGEITGDFHHSVSYAALGFFPWKAFLLTGKEQRILLDAARETLRNYQQTGQAEPVRPKSPPPSLMRRAGAFVTLRKEDQLRGCVGRHLSAEPLAHSIPALTLAAALEDSRFDPVKPTETDVEIEISVMSPLKLLSGAGDFRVNDHGGYLEAGYHRGLLLPQVATERGWTSAQFLEALARKTGVKANVYATASTRLFAFRAQVIG